MTVYRVTGRFRYRDHEPGELFETDLDPDVEERALRLGTIEVVERRLTELIPGSYRVPRRRRQTETTGRPSGALRIEGSK